MIIDTARDAADLLVPLFHACTGEKVVAAHLDGDRRLIGTIEAAGEETSVALPIRAIIGDAMRLGATGMIVAHNHPGGDPRPSEADLHATRELSATAGRLGIRLFDHLIVGAEGRCRSLRALGLI
jgi:DNA repair protein RadC